MERFHDHAALTSMDIPGSDKVEQCLSNRLLFLRSLIRVIVGSDYSYSQDEGIYDLLSRPKTKIIFFLTIDSI